MNFINEKEIYSLEYLGKGTYGSVYRYGDKAIKKYHDILYHEGIKNPCLKFNKRKFKLLKRKSNNIKETDLVNDLVFVDERFVGVSYKHINGERLGDVITSTTIEEKKDICYKLVRNAKELTKNEIYPCDYKLNNILYDENGDVKIIDLDDDLTKITEIPNPIYFELSLQTLRMTIINFLEEDNYDIDRDTINYLTRYKDTLMLLKKKILTYRSLEEYISSKTRECDITFMDYDNLCEVKDSNIVITYQDRDMNTSEYLKKISSLGIEVFDMLLLNEDNREEKKKKYIYSNNMNIKRANNM